MPRKKPYPTTLPIISRDAELRQAILTNLEFYLDPNQDEAPSGLYPSVGATVQMFKSMEMPKWHEGAGFLGEQINVPMNFDPSAAARQSGLHRRVYSLLKRTRLKDLLPLGLMDEEEWMRYKEVDFLCDKIFYPHYSAALDLKELAIDALGEVPTARMALYFGMESREKGARYVDYGYGREQVGRVPDTVYSGESYVCLYSENYKPKSIWRCWGEGGLCWTLKVAEATPSCISWLGTPTRGADYELWESGSRVAVSTRQDDIRQGRERRQAAS
jgi:hypothetical protein